VAKWKPADNFRGWPFIEIQAEFIRRDYTVDDEAATAAPFADDELADQGFYFQALWGFSHPWIAGIRFENVSADGDSVDIPGLVTVDPDLDASRNTRTRISPQITYLITEYTRLRLQINYDMADIIVGAGTATDPDESAVSVWIAFEVGVGAHPAHKY
jgi:hypothetical protein